MKKPTIKDELSTVEIARRRWNRLPKVRREQALYDERFHLVMRRTCAATGCKRDRAVVRLLELLFLAADIPFTDPEPATKKP